MRRGGRAFGSQPVSSTTSRIGRANPRSPHHVYASREMPRLVVGARTRTAHAPGNPEGEGRRVGSRSFRVWRSRRWLGGGLVAAVPRDCADFVLPGRRTAAEGRADGARAFANTTVPRQSG